MSQIHLKTKLPFGGSLCGREEYSPKLGLLLGCLVFTIVSTKLCSVLVFRYLYALWYLKQMQL